MVGTSVFLQQLAAASCVLGTTALVLMDPSPPGGPSLPRDENPPGDAVLLHQSHNDGSSDCLMIDVVFECGKGDVLDNFWILRLDQNDNEISTEPYSSDNGRVEIQSGWRFKVKFEKDGEMQTSDVLTVSAKKELVPTFNLCPQDGTGGYSVKHRAAH